MPTVQTPVDLLGPDPTTAPSPAESEAPWPFLALSAAEVAYLVELGVVELGADSPLAPLLEGRAPMLAPDEAIASSRRLRSKGLIGSTSVAAMGERPPAASQAGALFRCALEVLAAPEARLIIVRQSPGEEPSLIPLFLAGELAAPGFIDDEGLHLGVPMDRRQLLDSIRINVHGESPAGDPRGDDELGEPVSLSPLVLQAVETLWRGTGRALSEPISRQQARTLLAAMTGDAGMVQGLLQLLLQAGVMTERDGGYRIDETYRPWLERVLSGHSCALELLPAGASSPGEVVGDRLLFFGPPGRRVLCTTPEELAATNGEAESEALPADATLRFSAPSSRLLSWKLRRLFETVS